MGLEKWVEDITENVFLRWESDYAFWKPGFKVFFGPVSENPNIMIISLNPGGNGENFREEDYHRFKCGDFSAPVKNVYVEKENPMARKMKNFFNGYTKLLEQSVAFTVLFFRSKDIREWEKLDKQKRKEMENFSYETVREITSKVKPKIMLVIGFATYHRLKKHIFDEVKNEESKKGENGRIFLRAEWGKIPIFCIPHLTGSRITNRDFDEIRKTFFNIVDSL